MHVISKSLQLRILWFEIVIDEVIWRNAKFIAVRAIRRWPRQLHLTSRSKGFHVEATLPERFEMQEVYLIAKTRTFKFLLGADSFLHLISSYQDIWFINQYVLQTTFTLKLSFILQVFSTYTCRAEHSSSINQKFWSYKHFPNFEKKKQGKNDRKDFHLNQ